MSLMLKLLATIALLSSFAEASFSADAVKKFIEHKFKNNSQIKSITVSIEETVALDDPEGWEAHIINLNAVLKKDNRKVNQKMTWFSDGDFVTQELVNMKTGKNLADLIAPKFKNEYYDDSFLIYGNKNSKHKVVIFSDPLCPFCKKSVPPALEFMKKDPKMFAVYYYHFPLPSLHPSSVELTKAAIALELRGKAKDIVLNLYKVKVGAKERNVEKILKAFNKELGTDIKVKDLDSPKVRKHMKSDALIASDIMVQGTPTIFFDGELDKTKRKFKKVK